MFTKRHRWSTVAVALLALALLVPGAAWALGAGSQDGPAQTQPAKAAHAPQKRVPVIVQKADRSDRAEALVRSLGGAVTKDLSMINAFAAEIPAEALQQLAASPSVVRVAPDGAVESTATRTIEIAPSPFGARYGTGTRTVGIAPSPFGARYGTGTRTVGIAPAPVATPKNHFRETLGISRLGLTGQGIGVAVIDSGVDYHPDFSTQGKSRVVFSESFNPKATDYDALAPDAKLSDVKTVDGQSVIKPTASNGADDLYGHGTHVAGIIGGDGSLSRGLYTGVAPGAHLLNLKIADDQGMARESDVVAAMQWVYDNKDTYNIRVVNLSINSGDETSYHESALDAACEVLWFNEVVVIASAGNKGPAGGPNTINSAPANDPFIITVGASNEKGNSYRRDDAAAPFSAHGNTKDGFAKPEIAAPGTDIYSTLSSTSSWAAEYPERTQRGNAYFRLSGTSMSAPMVSGVVALLLEDEPNLTPDQVKCRLLATAGKYDGREPYLNAYAAVNGTTTESANTGVAASKLLWTGTEPVMWDSVMWRSVMWNSVMWRSVMWNSVMWRSVMWNSVDWSE